MKNNLEEMKQKEFSILIAELCTSQLWGTLLDYTFIHSFTPMYLLCPVDSTFIHSSTLIHSFTHANVSILYLLCWCCISDICCRL